jgi:hypothetical protein
MRLWSWIVAAILLAHPAAAQELKIIDPGDVKIVVNASEFVGKPAARARRRPESGSFAPESSVTTAVDELMLRAGGYEHVVLHSYALRQVEWGRVDLGNVIRAIFKNSAKPLVIDEARRHSRGRASGEYAQFTHFDGNGEFKCVAYVLFVDQYNRLLGIFCNPPSLDLTPEDALRHVNSVGIKGALDPG